MQDSDLPIVWPTRYAHINGLWQIPLNVEEVYSRKGFVHFAVARTSALAPEILRFTEKAYSCKRKIYQSENRKVIGQTTLPEVSRVVRRSMQGEDKDFFSFCTCSMSGAWKCPRNYQNHQPQFLALTTT